MLLLVSKNINSMINNLNQAIIKEIKSNFINLDKNLIEEIVKKKNWLAILSRSLKSSGFTSRSNPKLFLNYCDLYLENA